MFKNYGIRKEKKSRDNSGHASAFYPHDTAIGSSSAGAKGCAVCKGAEQDRKEEKSSSPHDAPEGARAFDKAGTVEVVFARPASCAKGCRTNKDACELRHHL